ncbi:hypothetical protein CEXT_414821 [Caerostris extrusa]|uniref:Uncharacterized protein n=1 Tax=Caerostris extrusa TaxID=172846 RepID=A0AAV4RVW2_CAEEX|nr:hypothetical protein CEXT_414821 [Caerostris extrusa]
MPLEAEAEKGAAEIRARERADSSVDKTLKHFDKNSNISTDVKENWSGRNRRKGSEREKKIPPFEIDFHPSFYDSIPFTAIRSKASNICGTFPPLFLSE